MVWADNANEIGSLLDPGVLRLKSGMVQIETYSGARMILEGPAELELLSPQEARLQYGKVSARVPEQAHGFKVYSGELIVTALATGHYLVEGDTDGNGTANFGIDVYSTTAPTAADFVL